MGWTSSIAQSRRRRDWVADTVRSITPWPPLKLRNDSFDQSCQLAPDPASHLHYFKMIELLRQNPGSGITDHGDSEAAKPPSPGGDDFEHRRHPHGVGAEPLQHEDLRGCLVAGAE